MRVSFFIAAAIVCGTLSAPAEAKSTRTSVPIAPRYLSAGNLVSPDEYRGVVPQVDARFQPVTTSLEGRFSEWREDPWHVPYKRSSWSTDFDGWSGGHRYRR